MNISNKKGKDKLNRLNTVMFMLMVIFVLSFSIGYAALNRDLKISGEGSFRPQEDIRITDISLSEIINNGIENYESDYSKTTIKLGVNLKEQLSEVKYKVEITNLGNTSMWIDSIEQPINNNTNMEYVIEGIGIKELINPGEVKEFYVTIKYKDGVSLPSNTNLDTTIKFNFVEPRSILAEGNTGDATSTFYNGTITKESVEEITFLPTLEVGEEAVGYWDASYNKNGTVIAWYTDSDGNDLYELYIGGVSEVEAPVNSSYLFQNFTNLKTINFDDYFDTSNATTMYGMFYLCTNITKLDLSGFDTSNTTDMQYMFSNCTLLTSLDVSSFNTSKVTNMSCMFYALSSLPELDVTHFDTSQVTSMAYLFYKCSSLPDINVSNFNTSKVTNMAGMFNGCSSLSSLLINNFDTSNVTNMREMFKNCSSFKGMVSVFGYQSGGTTSQAVSLYLDNFDTQNVNTVNSMFQGCTGITQVIFSDFNFVNVSDMRGMFEDCSSLLAVGMRNGTFSLTHELNDYPALGGGSGFYGDTGDGSWENYGNYFYVQTYPSYARIFNNCTSLKIVNLIGSDNTTYFYDYIKEKYDGISVSI